MRIFTVFLLSSLLLQSYAPGRYRDPDALRNTVILGSDEAGREKFEARFGDPRIYVEKLCRSGPIKTGRYSERHAHQQTFLRGVA